MERVLGNPTDPSDWKFEPLKELDGLLRCSICLEYYNTAMIMPSCSHNYCSLCIRRYLVVRPQCPTCAAPATDSQLRNNRILDELVEQFTGSRKEFMSLVSSHAATKSKNGLLQTSLASPQESTSSNRRSQAEIRSMPMQMDGISLAKSVTERQDSVCSHGNHPNTELGSQQNFGSSVCVPEPPSLLLLEESILAEETQTSSNSSKRLANDDNQNISSSKDRDTSGSHYKFQSPHTHSESLSDTGTTTLTSTRTTVKKQSSTSSLSNPLDPNPNPRTPLSFSADTSNSSTIFYSPSTPTLPLARRLSVKRETSPMCTPTSGCHTPSRAGRMAPTPSPSTSTHSVDCPVCGLLVHQKHINSHLDLCLNRTAKQSPNVSSGHSLPRLPKLCFNIMNEKQLKKKMKEYHLPTHGSRQAMISRLQEFTLQYNAQCDSLNPKTSQQIAQEVEKAEQTKLGKKPVAQQQPVRRDSTKEEIEQQRKSYEQAHGDNFAKLIGEVRRRGGRGGGGSSSGPKATGKAWRCKKEGEGEGEPRERVPRETSGGSSDVEIIERSREVLAVDSSDSGDELPVIVWAVASRMGTTTWPGNETGATTIPESPRVVRQSTRTKRKRYPITADATTSLDPDESHEPLGSETEAALSGEEDPDFMPATPNFRTTPTCRSKKRLKRK